MHSPQFNFFILVWGALPLVHKRQSIHCATLTYPMTCTNYNVASSLQIFHGSDGASGIRTHDLSTHVACASELPSLHCLQLTYLT